MPRRRVLPENSVCAQRRRNFWYNTQRQTHSCFDRLKRNLENFLCTSRQRGNPPLGAFSSASRTGLSRASLETRERIAPSFFARETGKGRRKERMAIGASEKLAQEGLCGNLDRLAVGKRVGSCVRKIAHDLERMRGAGSLRRQYQTDRLVGMVRSL